MIQPCKFEKQTPGFAVGSFVRCFCPNLIGKRFASGDVARVIDVFAKLTIDVDGFFDVAFGIDEQRDGRMIADIM